MINIFEINNRQYSERTVNGTIVYEIENFYKYPEKVKQFTTKPLPKLWKVATAPNGCYYHDRRLEAHIPDDSQIET